MPTTVTTTIDSQQAVEVTQTIRVIPIEQPKTIAVEQQSRIHHNEFSQEDYHNFGGDVAAISVVVMIMGVFVGLILLLSNHIDRTSYNVKPFNPKDSVLNKKNKEKIVGYYFDCGICKNPTTSYFEPSKVKCLTSNTYEMICDECVLYRDLMAV